MEGFIGWKILFLAHLFSVSWPLNHLMVNGRCGWWISVLYAGRSWHQERLGALSPIYQVMITPFYHHIYAFCPLSIPYGTLLVKPYKCVVVSKVTFQLSIEAMLFLGCFYMLMYVWGKKWGQGAVGLSHILEKSSIMMRSDQGGGPGMGLLPLAQHGSTGWILTLYDIIHPFIVWLCTYLQVTHRGHDRRNAAPWKCARKARNKIYPWEIQRSGWTQQCRDNVETLGNS